MKNFVLVGLAVIAVTLHECHAHYICGADLQWVNETWYKWKPWTGGSSPRNTINEAQRMVRLGHFNVGLTIGTAYNYKFAYYYNGVYNVKPIHSDHHVESLTSTHPDRFKWIATDVNNIKFLLHKHLVVGGCINSYPVLVGRMNDRGVYVYGAILVKPDDTRFQYVYKRGITFFAWSQYDKFDVLSFDDSCL